MKKEKKVSRSVSNWLTASIFVVILSWVLIGIIISGPISNLWMGTGGKYQSQAYALTFFACMLGVVCTLIVEVYFFNGMERSARSYEDDVRYYINTRNDLLKRLGATAANLEMSDIDLLSSTRFGSADFSVREINYRTQLETLLAREVRSALEEDRRTTQGHLNSLIEPKEPLKVARWRRVIMRIPDPAVAQ